MTYTIEIFDAISVCPHLESVYKRHCCSEVRDGGQAFHRKDCFLLAGVGLACTVHNVVPCISVRMVSILNCY